MLITDKQTIGQQHVTRTKQIPELSQQADLPLSLSGIATYSHAEALRLPRDASFSCGSAS